MSDKGRRAANRLGPLKGLSILESQAICNFFLNHAIIDSGDAKYMADKSTKITIFFFTIWEAL